uniref:sulfotransferase family protein n=1 Tax=Marinobacterium profundum TaxID=1714300 RepID=UPI000834A942|nr:sulfotransferase [Marinobacterium profundum]
MKRQIKWIKKYSQSMFEEIALEIKIKKNKQDGCDNLHQCKKSVELKLQASSPIFVISTGRTGTKFFSHLFHELDKVKAYHEPHPTLMAMSNDLYHAELTPYAQSLILKAARYETMVKHMLANIRYVESNQTLISLVDGILYLFPDAKIIFIVRDPNKFATSAYKKGWFENDTIWENNRINIKPVSTKETLISILDYWVLVNSRILIKAEEYPSNCKIFRLEDVVSDENKTFELLSFAGIHNFDKEKIKNKLSQKVNENELNSWDHDAMRKKSTSPDIPNFIIKNKDFLATKVTPIAEKLGYEI